MSEQLNKSLILVLLWLVLSVGFSSFAYGAETVTAVDVLSDSSVLVITAPLVTVEGKVRRLTIDTGGNLTATGEVLNGYFYNVIGAPSSMSGLALDSFGIKSFKIPGLIPIDRYDPSPSPGQGVGPVSVLINPQGDRVFLMYETGGERRIDVINYNSVTGTLDDVPLFTIPAGRSEGGRSGIERMAITQDGTKLYMATPWKVGTLNVHNASTGDLLSSLFFPGNTVPRGVCLSDNGDVGMAVNPDGSVIAFDVSTDTVLGTVSTGSSQSHQCAITADGTLGFVNDDFGSRVWVVDLTASPPRLAPGTNPIPVSNRSGDMSISLDQQFLIVTGIGSVIPQPISVIDISSRKEIHTFTFNTLPIVESVIAMFQDQTIQPIGDYLAKVLDYLETPATIQVTVSDPDPYDVITKVRFDLDGLIYEDTDPSDGWSWPNLDLGALPYSSALSPNKLTVVAYDSSNAQSTPVTRYFNIIHIEQPCFIHNPWDAFSFADAIYRFDRYDSYGCSIEIPDSIPFIGGRRIAPGLDFNILWEHSILSHQDLAEKFDVNADFTLLGGPILSDYQLRPTENSYGILNVDDEFNLTEAKMQWFHQSPFLPFFGASKTLNIGITVDLDVHLEGRYRFDLNAEFDNCLNFSRASFVPNADVRGLACTRASAPLGLIYVEVGGQANLPLWFIVPLTGGQNWGVGGEFWIDYWMEVGTGFCIRFFGYRKCFTPKVWDRSDGTLGPWAFGHSKPLTARLALQQSEPVTTNLPEVYAAPKLAADRSGNILMVWVHDSIEEKNASQPELYAAFGNTTGFQNVVPLTQDGAFDMDPDVAFDGNGNAMVVWTRNKMDA
ncbi:MAG: hypothetical protein JRD93_18050 [Deltaproteobacteria bacterium]|nr:hypothetical protein [Deltaproteobacteria bacterium]